MADYKWPPGGGGGGGAGSALTSAHLFVGNASNLAADVAMSGEASISNAGAVTLSNAAVIAKVLTGFSAGAGTVSSADSVLAAIQKIVGNLALVSTLEVAEGNLGATKTINFATGPAHYGVINATCTVTLSNYVSGSAYTFLVAADGTHDITWAGPTFDWGTVGVPDFTAFSAAQLVPITFYYSAGAGKMIARYST